MKPRAVIFDYGGVVMREDAAEFDEFAARHGLPPGVMWAAFHDIPEYRLSRTGRLDAAGYRKGVQRALARYLGEEGARAALDDWDRLREDVSPIEPEIRDLLARLKGRVLLGLLSNAGAGLAARLEDNGIAALFDDVVCSGDVGLAKPDPAVYRFAADRLHVEPEDCLFVDDMERNVLGAREAGMRAHHHHRTRFADLLAFLAEAGLRP